MNKLVLRKKYQKLRRDFSENFIEEKSISIANKCLELPIWGKKYFHLFISSKNLNEVETKYLLSILYGKDKLVIIPKIKKVGNNLDSFLLTDETKLKISKLGIPEPIDGIIFNPKKIDVVFVPLLAFDLEGNRVGYGKGYYDRFLKNCTSECIKVGVSFFPPEKKINNGTLDVNLNYCVTPDKIYSFS